MCYVFAVSSVLLAWLHVIVGTPEQTLRLSMIRNCLGNEPAGITAATAISIVSPEAHFSEIYLIEGNAASASFDINPGGTGTYTVACNPPILPSNNPSQEVHT